MATKECYICEAAITEKEFMVIRQNVTPETFGYVHHDCLVQATKMFTDFRGDLPPVKRKRRK
jgi:hypothetical protein